MWDELTNRKRFQFLVFFFFCVFFATISALIIAGEYGGVLGVHLCHHNDLKKQKKIHGNIIESHHREYTVNHRDVHERGNAGFVGGKKRENFLIIFFFLDSDMRYTNNVYTTNLY